MGSGHTDLSLPLHKRVPKRVPGTLIPKNISIYLKSLVILSATNNSTTLILEILTYSNFYLTKPK